MELTNNIAKARGVSIERMNNEQSFEGNDFYIKMKKYSKMKSCFSLRSYQ